MTIRVKSSCVTTLFVVALSLSAVSCGGGGSDSSATTTTVPSVPTVGTTTVVTTVAVDCPYSGSFNGTYSGSSLTAIWSWTCTSTTRSLSSNALPDHAIGTFPNVGNPNTITAQTISSSMTLTPTKGTANRPIGGPGGVLVYARNGVKFDPGTGGACPDTITATSQCDLGNGTGNWRIEALGQTSFNFGADANNAHVQPTGEYHYHGMPEGVLANRLATLGRTTANPTMLLVGWAGDGFPVYARYCYSSANDATSAIKVCTGSFAKKTVPDAGRPSVNLVPLGAFLQDWAYTAGSGDLDDCNGRTGVTPEFPNGIYYYMATDSYPYFSRCVKGA